MFENIKADFQRIYRSNSSGIFNNIAEKLRIIANAQGFQALTVHRFYFWTRQSSSSRWEFTIKKVLFIPAYLSRLLIHKVYDVKIAKDADIGRGFCLYHFGGIRIGSCSIGENCTVHHQVKIGLYNTCKPDDTVILEDRVWIGAHSTISTSVTIGKKATISAGTTVAKDVSSHHLIAGPTGRILRKDFDNSNLLQPTFEETSHF